MKDAMNPFRRFCADRLFKSQTVHHGRAEIRSGLQDGGRAAARERRRSVLAADHQPAGEPARRDRAQAHDGGDGRAVLRQLRAGAAPHRARHRRHRGPGSRRPAAGAVQRPLRQPLLPADPHLRGDHRQAGGGHPAPRQDAGRGRGGAGAAPCHRPYPRPLAGGRHRGPRRQPLRPARGHGVVRAQPRRLHLRPRRQRGAAAPGSAHLAEDAALGRVAGEADKVRRYGEFRYAAKSWNVERRVIARVEAGPQGADSRFIVTNLRGPAQGALREGLLRPRPGRKPDQGAQAAPRLRPHLLHQGDRQPVPPADPHRRLLAAAQPARPGAPDLVLARRPVRHDPPLPDQGGRPRHRDGHPDQGRPADRLPLPDRLRHARRPHRQAAAVNDGAGMPRNKPLGATSNPDHRVTDATKNHARRRRHTAIRGTSLNDPG